MFNHKSLSEDVLLYVDKTSTLNDSIYVEGWFAHNSKKIKQIILNGKPINTILVNRPDVKNVYPFIPSDLVGVEFIVPSKDIDKPIGLLLEDSTIIENVCTLERWYVKSSGFNNLKSEVIIVDNFYSDPDAVRNFAIKNLKFGPSKYNKGQRSESFILDGTKEAFEKILGRKVLNWNHSSYANGVFQFCTPSDPLVYHIDDQMFAAIVYLTPDAPLRTGTCTYKSQITGASRFDKKNFDYNEFQKTFKAGGTELNFYDNSTLDVVDNVANVYNRLVLWDARRIHAAEKYFGDSIENSRFFHIFFFDIE